MTRLSLWKLLKHSPHHEMPSPSSFHKEVCLSLSIRVLFSHLLPFEAPAELYWNYDTKENFAVVPIVSGGKLDNKCVRKVLTASSQTSVLVEDTLYLKPSAILGFNPRNQKDTTRVVLYQSNGTTRGFPVDIFTSCFYVSDIQATVLATYYVLDEQAVPSPSTDNQSVVLQFDVIIKNAKLGKQSFTYNIFRYVPNPREREQRQSLETPAGVYCAGRSPGLEFPKNIPDRVSSNVESFIPEFNSSIISTHSLFDTEFQFSRLDAWYPDPAGRSEYGHYTEINDFALGLTFQYNQSSHQCLVRDISNNTADAVSVDGQPSLLQMGTPQHLFLADDVVYQYTGEKPCRDRVMCHVWIGEKPVGNLTVQHREWYWAFSVNNQPLTRWIPMKTILKTYYNESLVNSFEFSKSRESDSTKKSLALPLKVSTTTGRIHSPSSNWISRWPNVSEPWVHRVRDRSVSSHDEHVLLLLLSLDKYNLGVFSFRIGNERNYPVFEELNYLRLHIWETLLFTMFVRPIRLSNLLVDRVGNELLVTFTLLDAPPRKGPVENLYNETSIDALIARLVTVINSNSLIFRARTNSKQVILRAIPKSLNVAVQEDQVKRTKSNSSATVFWITFTIGGAILGAVVGFFVFARMAQK